jgi:hypothetical protein
MSNKFFSATHPKNGCDVVVKYDEDFRFVDATYDDGETVDLTDRIKSQFQDDITHYCQGN